MPTALDRPPIQPQVPPVLVPATQPNIVQPPHNNCENPQVLRPLFLFTAICSVPTVHPNIVNGTLVPGYSYSPAAHSITDTALGVNIRTPTFERGIFPYRRHHVVARLSLTGAVLLQYRDVVLGPVLPNDSQLVLWCYAECSSCSSSRHPQCSPVGFYLDPLRDRKYNQGFILDPSSGTLAGNVTFTIEHRPRRPKAQEHTRRCASESLR